MMLVVALLALCPWAVLGISSGNTSMCDAHNAMLGCTAWGWKPDPNDDRRQLVNRLNCTLPDVASRLMPWSGAPIRSNLFSVRSGNEGPIASDVAYYHPDEYVTITVRALNYKQRYRGLLMYALNTANEVVGWFQFAPETEAVPFWTPPFWASRCATQNKGNGVLHKNADEKPYTFKFRWKAPPAGTGTVTFKALFKAGPANTGEFYWPSNGGRNDLVLSERNSAVDGPVPAKTWFKASTHTQTCAQVCTAAGRSGVDDALMAQTNNGGEGLSPYHPSASDAYARTELCRFPFVSSCATDSPGIDSATSFCTFKPPTCPSWRVTSEVGTRLRLCACLAAAVQVLPCPADQGWPQTNPGDTRVRACPAGQTGNHTRPCSATGVWGTAVSTCVTPPSCTDGIQNQGEYAVDCGGPCSPCLNCPTINCGAHGTCVEGSPASCLCNGSWTGNRCETPPANPCDTWVCANGATCQVENQAAKCLCVGTWTGVHCDQLPAATCVDGIKNQGETGVDCGGPCAACDSFFWEVGVWSDCDRSCGGGIRTRGQTCKNSTGQVRPSSDCAAIHLPITQENCNPDPCPVYTWVTGAFDTCTAACGGGTQTRTVECWSSVGPSVVTTPGLCTESMKPVSSQVCNTPACATAQRWVSDAWGACSLDCGGGIQTRANRCLNTANVEVMPTLCTGAQPATQQACNIFACVKYDWFLCPNWGPCTATCGGGDGMLGQQYRDLFCSASNGKQVDLSLCDEATKPKNKLTVCNTFPCRDFNWMANGDWSACNGTHRERSFHCHAADGAVALTKECAHVPLPIAAIPCTPGVTECYDLPPTPFFLSAAPKMQTSLPFALAAIGSFVASPRLGLLSVAVLGLSLVVPAEAHNWMHTPGRASFQASTVSPCQARKDSDLHAQVVRGQRFTMKFATGHDRDSYFVTVMGDDADWLANDNFETMVDDYLNTAGANEDHLGDYTRRYHGFYGQRGNQGSYDSRTDPIGSMFTGPIQPTDNRFPNHTRSPTSMMYIYTNTALAKDKRASYYNSKYPWIISAARMPHLYHLPDDFDAFHWSIPTQQNVFDGHVIVHWRWSGYYDCIDVDLRAGSTQVQYPDGRLNSSNHIWSQVDHCQYEAPIGIMTQCMEVIDSVQPCINALGQGEWNQNNRYGLNVVPFRNPLSVNPDFLKEVAIPWRDGACSSTWNKLPGSVSETQLDWTTWLNTPSVTTVTAGTTCGNTMVDNSDFDLKRAVGYCVGNPSCTGISWENVAGQTVQSPGNKHFRLCSGSGNQAATGWTLYRPGTLSTPTYQNNPTSIINFSPLSRVAVTTAQTGMVTDAGYMYGARNGQVYGWSCDSTVDCEWCCSQWACQNGQSLPGCCNGDIDFTYNYGANLRCPNQIDNWKYFNYNVANGVYQVTTRHQGGDYLDVDIGGCNVEGVRMVKNLNDNTPAGVQLTTMVEVTDGKLTFNGDAGIDGGCWFTNWIKFTLKGPVGTWPQIWMPPPVANPVWEQNVGTPVPIGLVTVRNYEFFRNDVPVCSHWWLFKGSYCYPNKASGWFNDTTQQGALVGVSNVSCLTGNCAGFVQCGFIQKANNPYEDRYYVDCNGKVGQYVFVKLPGANRYLTLDIEAYLYQPLVPANDNPFVCYAVEARPATTTSPEYIISLDPEDPIFYSTCYVRNPNVEWLAIVGAPPSNPDRWRFDGRCISCESFERNKAVNKPNFASLPVPWVIKDGECVDCTIETPPPVVPTTNWKQVYMSDCDDPATSTTTRGLPPCAGSGFDSCQKRLFARGRTESEPTWGSSPLSVTECRAVAANDPECSSTVQYRDYNGYTVCECHRSHPCCGRCTPNTWSGSTVRTTDPKAFTQIYDSSVSTASDAFCATGLKSADNVLCCPNYCKNAAGTNVCGVASTCKNAVGGGICCKGDQMNLFVGSCATQGPPCKL